MDYLENVRHAKSSDPLAVVFADHECVELWLEAAERDHAGIIAEAAKLAQLVQCGKIKVITRREWREHRESQKPLAHRAATG